MLIFIYFKYLIFTYNKNINSRHSYKLHTHVCTHIQIHDKKILKPLK